MIVFWRPALLRTRQSVSGDRVSCVKLTRLLFSAPTVSSRSRDATGSRHEDTRGRCGEYIAFSGILTLLFAFAFFVYLVLYGFREAMFQ